MAPVLNTGPLEGTEHVMLSFLVRKEIIKNDNSLVVILLLKCRQRMCEGAYRASSNGSEEAFSTYPAI